MTEFLSFILMVFGCGCLFFFFTIGMLMLGTLGDKSKDQFYGSLFVYGTLIIGLGSIFAANTMVENELATVTRKFSIGQVRSYNSNEISQIINTNKLMYQKRNDSVLIDLPENITVTYIYNGKVILEEIIPLNKLSSKFFTTIPFSGHINAPFIFNYFDVFFKSPMKKEYAKVPKVFLTDRKGFANPLLIEDIKIKKEDIQESSRNDFKQFLD